MIEKLKSWASTHLSPLKIDFMSLNRLRSNQTAESVFEQNLNFTDQARKGLLDLRAYLTDSSLGIENPKVLVNPFGRSPLFALVIFQTEKECRASYQVKGHREENHFRKDLTELSRLHLIPLFGLYAGEANMVTLELFDSEGKPLASKELIITTSSLPYDLYHEDQANYLIYKDSAGDVRFYLDINTLTDQACLMDDRHLALVEKNFSTPNYQSPAPSHFHELDFYGFVYRTYYVGSGIDGLSYQADTDRFYITSHEHSLRGEDAILEMIPQTGEVPKMHSHLPEGQAPSPFASFEDFGQSLPDPSCQDLLSRFEIPAETYPVVGWLCAPRLHKGASIQTTDCISKEDLFSDYGVRIVLQGDTLNITMHDQIVQEILFCKYDMIFQMDFSAYIDKDQPTTSECITVAIPFAEMHSGTYNMILRFVNNDQAVIADGLMLSRRRS
ncbi:MAG: aryl-sulfate sulfotransferase N-terminal domain-containing protein [Eubacterium sp.]|nr:aryl-sulfate sulfotransferase N-terminal domain-containing protein [Eubacterium sp.]